LSTHLHGSLNKLTKYQELDFPNTNMDDSQAGQAAEGNKSISRSLHWPTGVFAFEITGSPNCPVPICAEWAHIHLTIEWQMMNTQLLISVELPLLFADCGKTKRTKKANNR